MARILLLHMQNSIYDEDKNAYIKLAYARL